MRTRADSAIAQELDELLAKSTPYALSSPSFGSPTIHDFVKGLILSTNIIEVIGGKDKHLPNGFRADWGQVIDEKDGNTLSKECDIIIYKDKPLKLIENKSIRFVLVGKKQTKIVIEVKSSIQSVTADIRNYCKELKKSVSDIWFIAECCWAKSKNRADTIEQDLKNAGYKHFFYFYRMNDKTLIKTIDYEPFIKFIKLIRRIK
ncbi:MAG: DUF6602 domain-containing protein [Thermodesulfobacteriota bacterium]